MTSFRWISSFILVFTASLSFAAQPATQAEIATPHQVIESVTTDFLQLLKAKNADGKDMDTLYQKVEGVLDPVVSFSFISKAVMHRYYKAASPQQREAFAKAFKRSMVETLTKGMLNFADLETKVVPPKGDISGQKKVEVIQEVISPTTTHLVAYTMAYSSKSKEWKLINVVLNGVNLGNSFREQFSHSAKQNKGDLDAVIAGWSSDKKETASKS